MVKLVAKQIVITSFVVIAIFLAQSFSLAQVWQDPDFAPPDNPANIPSISQLGGDNLGNHRAQFGLTMEQWSLLRVQSNNDNPALVIRSYGAGPGVYSYSTGAYSASLNSNSQETAIRARNGGSGSGFGLSVSSASSVSARIFGFVTLRPDGSFPAQVRIGNDDNNLMYVGSAPTSGQPDPVNDLYWGRVLLCDADDPQKNCGYRSTPYVADNLGFANPHLAQQSLDMDDNRILGVQAGSSDSLAALDTSYSGSLNPAVRTTNIGSGGVGIASAVLGQSSSRTTGHGGLYALHQAQGPGVVAVSEQGASLRLYGRLNVFGAGKEKLVFDPAGNTTALTINADSTGPTASLYWGDELLCDHTAAGCGWLMASGSGNEYWDTGTYAPNIYYNRLVAAKVGLVGIGTNNPQYQLDVAGLTRATALTSGNTLVSGSVSSEKSFSTKSALIQGNLTVSGASGLLVDAVSADSIEIAGVSLTESDLFFLINKCRQDGYCTHVPTWP